MTVDTSRTKGSRTLSRGAARMAEIQAIQAAHHREVETAVSQHKKNSAHFQSLAEVVATKSSFLGERFPHVDAVWARGLGRNALFAAQAFAPMDPAVYAGIKASISPTRRAFVLPQIPHSLKTRRKRGAQYEDDEYTTSLAAAMVDSFKAGLGDPSDLWLYPPPDQDSDSDASEEDDPDAIPRRKISTRIANALVIAASSLGKLEMEVDAEEARLRRERHAPSPYAWLIMQPVYAEILEDKYKPLLLFAFMCKPPMVSATGIGMNQINAEAVESAWAYSNPLPAGTKEMGGGMRRSAYDEFDIASSWNQRKQDKIDALLKECTLRLQYMRHEHHRLSRGVSASKAMKKRTEQERRRYLEKVRSMEID
ncbi:hypothetical protein R3P38DRAFT_3288173 [Favolaschia claudopus]|uniref:Uncharacterized protein n=1 Tax=Favolaschia claudopus TaxID=2862362 RepID=A0AAV9ZXM8_9AGAR